MKPHSLLALLVLALPTGLYAEEARLEIGGVQITRGMSAEWLRSALVAPYQMQCDESTPRDENDFVPCMISTTDGTENRVKVYLENGRVVTAWQPYDVSDVAFDAFLSLHQLLLQLTEGKDTCAVVRIGTETARQLLIALPEQYVAVDMQEHNRPHVGIRVGLRQIPTPDLQQRDCWPALSTSHAGEANLTDSATTDPANAPPN